MTLSSSRILLVLSLAPIIVCLIAIAAVFSSPDPAAMPAAVRVNVERGHGSGVHIGKGMVISAAHVVGDEKTANLLTEDGKTASATVLWVNKDYDVALLSAPSLVAKKALLLCDDQPVGTLIQTHGNPLNLEFIRTYGRVASNVKKRGIWQSTFIGDITVAGGVSGGPVYDSRQRVVGIVVGTAVQAIGISGSVVALTYIVPSSAICSLLAR